MDANLESIEEVTLTVQRLENAVIRASVNRWYSGKPDGKSPHELESELVAAVDALVAMLPALALQRRPFDE